MVARNNRMVVLLILIYLLLIFAISIPRKYKKIIINKNVRCNASDIFIYDWYQLLDNLLYTVYNVDTCIGDFFNATTVQIVDSDIVVVAVDVLYGCLVLIVYF